MFECLVNGEISTFITAANRGLYFADGVIEVIPVQGGRPRRWQAHMDRLGDACARLDLAAPPQSILLREVQTVSAGLSDAVVQIIVAREGSCEHYMPKSDAGSNRMVSVHPYPQGILERARNGVEATICNMRLAIQPALGGINHLSRLEWVLAASELREKPGTEGLLLDTEGHVISTLSANIFIVMEDRLLTPRLDRCGVRGVLRAQILSSFSARSEQRRIQEDFLRDAHEVFLCDSVRGIAPVTRIDDWRYETGPVTRELQTWLLEGSRTP